MTVPQAQPKVCLQPGCYKLTRNSHCQDHLLAAQKRRREGGVWLRARPSAAKRGYDRRWRKARLLYLAKHPYCELKLKCKGAAATEIDHIEPHKGDAILFWDTENWQAACKPCHSTKTASGG